MNIFIITGAGGFIGGSIAAGLARDGHTVRGLIRRAEQSNDLKGLGIEPVIGKLDHTALLTAEARAVDVNINAASSDYPRSGRNPDRRARRLEQAVSAHERIRASSAMRAAVTRRPTGSTPKTICRSRRSTSAARGHRQSRAGCRQTRCALGGSVQHADLRYGHGAVPNTASVLSCIV